MSCANGKPPRSSVRIYVLTLCRTRALNRTRTNGIRKRPTSAAAVKTALTLSMVKASQPAGAQAAPPGAVWTPLGSGAMRKTYGGSRSSSHSLIRSPSRAQGRAHIRSHALSYRTLMFIPCVSNRLRLILTKIRYRPGSQPARISREAALRHPAASCAATSWLRRPFRRRRNLHIASRPPRGNGLYHISDKEA